MENTDTGVLSVSHGLYRSNDIILQVWFPFITAQDAMVSGPFERGVTFQFLRGLRRQRPSPCLDASLQLVANVTLSS